MAKIYVNTLFYFVSDFEREALKLLRQINERSEHTLGGVTKLTINLVPNEKVLSRPKGMPTLPLRTLESVQTMETYLCDDDNLSYTVSIFL